MRSLKSELAKLTQKLARMSRETHAPLSSIYYLYLYFHPKAAASG
jgi:hypothetical protein